MKRWVYLMAFLLTFVFVAGCACNDNQDTIEDYPDSSSDSEPSTFPTSGTGESTGIVTRPGQPSPPASTDATEDDETSENETQTNETEEDEGPSPFEEYDTCFESCRQDDTKSVLECQEYCLDQISYPTPEDENDEG